ncbi:MAG: hypothetical protein HY519_01170 [Candidatus Aenigmarchaeota archaeon]|nr:hypothetical protein [Candidatus Aenigmarchaeota archaeon]
MKKWNNGTEKCDDAVGSKAKAIALLAALLIASLLIAAKESGMLFPPAAGTGTAVVAEDR